MVPEGPAAGARPTATCGRRVRGDADPDGDDHRLSDACRGWQIEPAGFVRDSEPIEVFQFGFFRFHFFWVTLIWPWVGAVVLSIVLGWGGCRALLERQRSGLPRCVPLLAIRWRQHRRLRLRRLLPALGSSTTGALSMPAGERPARRWHRCADMGTHEPGGTDRYARFDRCLLRSVSPDPSRSRRRRPALLACTTRRRVTSSSSTQRSSARTGSGLSIQAGEDAQLIVTVADHEAMRQCLTLEVGATLRPSQADVTQVFYLRPDDDQFAPERVTTTEISADGEAWSTVSLMLFSDEGFGDESARPRVLPADGGHRRPGVAAVLPQGSPVGLFTSLDPVLESRPG